jgi:acyl dehydratase
MLLIGLDMTPLPTHSVRAFNTAAASENKIHDDTVAQRFGFRGALVPGVEVFAYMAHVPVAHFGCTWLERGQAECRFLKPVYDGDIARVTATHDRDGLALAVESAGERCATGRASMPAPGPAPALDSLAAGVPPAERPPASEESLAQGRALGIVPLVIDRTALSAYLEAISETEPLYRAEGIVHPGQILRLANQALVQNVVLGPWIHVGSTIAFHGLARTGDELTLRSRITSNAVNKGHALVAFDAIIVADGARAVAAITHTAIWRPRQVADAG